MGFDPWTIVAEIGIEVGLKLLQQYLSVPPPDNRARQLTQQPTTNEGAPIPMVFGQVRIRQPGLVWYGRLMPYDEYTAVNGSFSWTVPAAYGINMLFDVGIPMGPLQPGAGAGARLTGMWVGDTKLRLNLGHLETVRTAQSVVMGATPGYTNKFDCQGQIQFFAGSNDQVLSNHLTMTAFPPRDVTMIATFMRGPSPLLLSAIPDNQISGYRNQMLVALTGHVDWTIQSEEILGYFGSFIVGQSPTIPAFSFEVRSTRQRYNSFVLPTGDADPIAVIYDLLTMPWGKMNIDPLLIDGTTFANASGVLLGERHGYSRVIDTTMDAKALLQEIANQICCTIYQDPYTGTVKIKLIRADYDLNATQTDGFGNTTFVVPLFTESSIRDFEEYEVGGWQDTINQVRVRYNARQFGYVDSIVVAQNMASAVMQDLASQAGAPAGKLRSVTLEYPGVCEVALADMIAKRDLNLLSQPLARARVVLDRSAHSLRPGDVFQITFPEYVLNKTPFRVLKVDLGQLADNKVTVDCVQDIFGNAAGSYGGVIVQPYIPTPEPVITRKITEAPYFMLRSAWLAGRIFSPDVQQLLTMGTPDDGAERFSEQTAYGVNVPFSSDTLLTPFPLAGRLNTAYARELEPYDTTTGILIDTLSNGYTPAKVVLNGSFSAIGIRANGGQFLMIDDEIISYESATDMGGGIVRLNNIWRALLDTAPKSHAVGARVYWLNTSLIGTSGWDNIAGIQAQMVPKIWFVSGSGEDPIDTVNVQGRGLLPARVGDLVATSEVMSGTPGVPQYVPLPTNLVGSFKSATKFEDGIGLVWKKRDRLLTTVSRGDDADEAPSDVDPTRWDIYAQKIRTGYLPSPGLNDTEVAIQTQLIGPNAADPQTIGAAGYGDVDMILHTRRSKPAGGHGILIPVIYSEWDAPKIRVRAERWRNLLANPRFAFGLQSWTTIGGTPAVLASAASLSLIATDTYLTGANVVTVSQTVDVSGYKPRGMSAYFELYMKRLSGGADTITVTMRALDASNAILATNTRGPVSPSTTEWTLMTNMGFAFLACPVGTTQIQVQISFTNVVGANNVAFTEVKLRLGSQLQGSLLVDGTFAAGISAPWVVDAGGWLGAQSAIKSVSPTYAQPGAFAQSIAHQDFDLTTLLGMETGVTAVVTGWRAQTLVNDSGKIDVSFLDAGSVVLSTTSTGTETLPTLNNWYQRRLALDSPPNARFLRITITGNRSLGAGNSGACFDDINFTLHKDLDPRYHRQLIFDTPPVQPVPSTWQQWHASYQDLYLAGIGDPVVFGGSAIPSSYNTWVNMALSWPDGNFHSGFLPAVINGNFGGGVSSVTGYRFARASGVNALDLSSVVEGSSRVASPTSADAMTVIALIRIDEINFAAQCGVTGRRDNLSGWGIEIDATGHPYAILQGTLGTVVATRPTTVHDGALHLVGIVIDPVAHTLTIYDERGGTTVSTVGIGEISTIAPLRLGRSRTSIDVMPGVIAREYAFTYALTAAQVARHWNYAKDPTAALTTYNRSGAGWAPGFSDPVAGVQMVKTAADQVALGYTTNLTTDGGTGWGLAIAKGSTNLIPSTDFTNGAVWVKDAQATLTQGILDATSRLAGVSVLAPDFTNGLSVIGLAMTATATLTVMFVANAPVAGDITIALSNANGVVKQNLTATLGVGWKIYTLNYTLWDGSTPTANLKFGQRFPATNFAFNLSSAMWASQGVDASAIWPDPGATVGSVNALLTESPTAQFNAEGEVIVVGVATKATPVTGSLIQAANGGDKHDQRELWIDGTAHPTFSHFDSAGAEVVSTGTIINWTQVWTVRGRWCELSTLDNAATPFAGIVTTGSVNSAVYGRAATWAYGTVLTSQIKIGGAGTNGGTMNGFLRSVTIRAREEKLV